MIHNETLIQGRTRFIPGCMYRMSHDVEAVHLRGRTVVFTGYIKRWFDVTRAIVTTLDGTEEWWIKPSCLLEM